MPNAIDFVTSYYTHVASKYIFKKRKILIQCVAEKRFLDLLKVKNLPSEKTELQMEVKRDVIRVQYSLAFHPCTIEY